jgi:glutathione S-transferase
MCAVERVFHIARASDWAQAQREGAYRVSSLGMHLDEVGFIHLSFARQVKTVADARYRDMRDLVLLELDPERLIAPIRIEAGEDGHEQFPHLYGEIGLDAVQTARPYPPRSDGTFEPLV